tara:strand:- start:87 stop:665 length:579 start_codon:yes stop_codon:yes gene_type:complete
MDKDSPVRNIESAISFYRNLAIFMIVLLLCGYFFWFAGINHQSVSSDVASWGAFGDFIGGLLNPVVAFLAFLLLARSLRIQGYELRQATSAFKESAISQNEQAKLLRDSALTQYKLARIELVKLRIDAESKQIQSLVDLSFGRPIETKIYWFGKEITLKEALEESQKRHTFHETEMCGLLKQIGDIVGAYKK